MLSMECENHFLVPASVNQITEGDLKASGPKVDRLSKGCSDFDSVHGRG
jgi:hypothetical protein